MRLFVPLVCAAAALTPAVALAQPPAAGAATASTAASDARCLMAMAALSSVPDKNMSGIGHEGVIYFAGRVKAHEPGYDFGTRLKSVAASMNGPNLQTEVQRCGPMVVEALQQLEAAQKTFGPPPGAAAPAKPQTSPATPAPAKPK